MGWSPTLTWLRWGPKMQLHRRILQPPFVKSKVGQYASLQRKEALICSKGFLDDPSDWTAATRRFGVAIVLKISYGLDVDGPSSKWVQLAEQSSNAIAKSGAPASSIMDRFPASELVICVGGREKEQRLLILKNVKSTLPSDVAPISRTATVCSKMAFRDRIYYQRAV